MPELEAYRRSLQPHRHDWRPLGGEPGDEPLDWCPACGAVRQAEHDDAACPELDSATLPGFGFQAKTTAR